MIHLTTVLAAAENIQAFCQIRNWPFCFIGGIAVQRWGEPRLTQDVDLTLLTGFGSEEGFVDTLLQSYWEIDGYGPNRNAGPVNNF